MATLAPGANSQTGKTRRLSVATRESRATSRARVRAPDRETAVTSAGTNGRAALQMSPYARRSSAGGVRMSPVTRRLNMAGDGGEARRSSACGVDRVERGGRGGGVSALESFRAVRRASLEREKKVREDGERAQRLRRLSTETGTGMVPVGAVTEGGEAGALPMPDRSDPRSELGVVTPVKKATRRASARFSDADVCLDDVERLKNSLGRRRSYDRNEPLPETPKLRRSSLGKRFEEGCENPYAHCGLDDRNGLLGEGVLGDAMQRSPLRCIERNGDNVSRGIKRASIVPKVDEEEKLAWANEDVEDLGVW